MASCASIAGSIYSVLCFQKPCTLSFWASTANPYGICCWCDWQCMLNMVVYQADHYLWQGMCDCTSGCMRKRIALHDPESQLCLCLGAHLCGLNHSVAMLAVKRPRHDTEEFIEDRIPWLNTSFTI